MYWILKTARKKIRYMYFVTIRYFSLQFLIVMLQKYHFVTRTCDFYAD